MPWEQSLIDNLDAAFNESDVRGFTFDAVSNEARLLLEVLALPEAGPIDPDVRRVILMSGIARIEIRLRLDTAEPGPVIPLASLDALSRFFDSLTFADSMYGWEFVDVEQPSAWWTGDTSLIATGASPAASHTLLWFTECGDGTERFALGGVVEFADMDVERADGTPIALEDFALAGARWWKAFNDRDPRLSVPAQHGVSRAARTWWPDRTRESVVVEAGEWDRG